MTPFVLSLLAACSPAARLQEAAPATLPAGELGELQTALERLAESYHIPGMSAALVRHRAVVWSHGFGYADLEQGVWATPDTRYRLASVSKPFAAVLVMQLVERGELPLDALHDQHGREKPAQHPSELHAH